MINAEVATPTFNTRFIQVLYNEPNTYPTFSGRLAPITGTVLNSYYLPGQILAYYDAHAPSGYQGYFVNYSAASGNADQAIPVAILTDVDIGNSQPYAGGSATTWVQIAYIGSPMVISSTAVANANEPADITGFLTEYKVYKPLAGSLLGAAYNGVSEVVYQVRG